MLPHFRPPPLPCYRWTANFYRKRTAMAIYVEGKLGGLERRVHRSNAAEIREREVPATFRA